MFESAAIHAIREVHGGERMIKAVKDRVWAFDAEWVPDLLAGRLLYDIPEDVSDPEAIMRVMWEKGGATEEDPTPFLKLVQCRVVSIAAVERRVKTNGEIVVHLLSLPRDPADENERLESSVLGTFLDAIGEHRPQLVGYNSQQSDLSIFVQRGMVLGLRAAGFSRRPEKPWEGIDYFARGSDWNIDLRDVLAGFGRGIPSLHELAVQAGVPGKMEVDGNEVARLWLEGRYAEIVAYNEYDALTTYLVWLRVAHFAGHFSKTEYAEEQQRLRALVERESESSERAHLRAYLEEWDRLSARISAQPR